MSTAEMQVELKRLIDNTEDEHLLNKMLEIINGFEQQPSVEDIYADAVKQYGNTLRKLAQ